MLKDFLPPHIYRIEGQPAYFDPVRKKYVQVTPRETVRQRVVPYLIQELDVPQKMIRIREKLSYFDYAEKLGCAYCILTNAEEIFCFYIDAEDYVELETVPNYHEMLKARRQNADATF